MQHKNLVLTLCLIVANTYAINYKLETGKMQSQFRAKLQQKAAAQKAAGVPLYQQVSDVKNQIIEKQAQLDAAKAQCSQVSAYEQAFDESCMNVEIYTQELADLNDLLNNLHQQQMQLYTGK